MQKRIILLLIICFTLTACNTIEKSINSSTASIAEQTTEKTSENVNQTSTSSTSKADENTDLIDKQNAYIDLNNFITGNYYSDVISRYFTYFGTDTFNALQTEPEVIAVIQYDIDIIDKALEYSNKEPRLEQFDAAVQDLVPKLKNLIDVMNDAHSYYNQKDYLDDNFAKGKEYHTQIVSLYFDQLSPSLDMFFEQVNKYDEEQTKKDMQQLLDSDFMLQYSMLDVLVKARDIASEVDSQNIDSSNLLELNLTVIKEKYSKLIEAINNLQKYADDSSRYKKENIMEIQIEQYLDDAGLTKAAVTEMIQRVENKEAVDQFDIQYGHTSYTSGTPENLNSQISSLVDAYNMMISNQNKQIN